MGDRANVLIKSKETVGIYLYTHWEGYRLPQIVQNALKKHKRWDDEPYLTRIIFCEMVKGYENELTGFGISVSVYDGSDRIIRIDTHRQTVTLLDSTYAFAK